MKEIIDKTAANLVVSTRGAHGGSRVSDLETLQRCWEQFLPYSTKKMFLLLLRKHLCFMN